ncbi:hypothetical protein CBD41_09055 [bacterium TMED181]|nr:MAG: hypothetical protein CBD41_09055 [bacterium TMED181]
MQKSNTPLTRMNISHQQDLLFQDQAQSLLFLHCRASRLNMKLWNIILFFPAKMISPPGL